jgi:hypothetical protein
LIKRRNYLQRAIRSAVVLSLCLASANCARQPRAQVSPETARRELALRGINFKEKEFVMHAGNGDAWAVRLFLAAGMSPDVKDERGATPLTAAMINSQKSVVKILLDKNANPNVLDRDGKTPLIRAAQAADEGTRARPARSPRRPEYAGAGKFHRSHVRAGELRPGDRATASRTWRRRKGHR